MECNCYTKEDQDIKECIGVAMKKSKTEYVQVVRQAETENK